MTTFTFEITPLYMGEPQVNERYEITTDNEAEAEELRSGWTVNGNGEPVRLPYQVREVMTATE